MRHWHLWVLAAIVVIVVFAVDDILLWLNR